MGWIFNFDEGLVWLELVLLMIFNELCQKVLLGQVFGLGFNILGLNQVYILIFLGQVMLDLMSSWARYWLSIFKKCWVRYTIVSFSDEE